MAIRDLAVFTFLASCLVAQFISSVSPSCNSDDLKALQGFLQGLESGINGWLGSSSDCCTWDGVTCEASVLAANHSNISLRVISLELGNRRLQGVVSKSLAGLDQLRTLNLSQNFFTGSLPRELLRFEKLEVLDLSSNDLLGSAPLDIHLPSVRYLDISGNLFFGSVDAGICKTARQLQILNLSMNKFSGKIPVGFGNCSSLELLFLGSNFLTGFVPRDLFQLPKLSELDLGDNKLSGALSSGFGNLSSLAKMDISNNEFSGNLPDAFQNLKKLEQFTASSNKFVGPLPTSLLNTTISLLNLRNNSLSGPIDSNWSAMVHLTSLNLASNQFSGPIPESLSSCQHLSILSLAHNNLQGQVPEEFSKLKSLTHLSLTNTSLHNLSAALLVLQQCKKLTTLVLSLNFQAEVMPAHPNLQFKNLKALVIVDCGLTGLVPHWLRGSTNLELLDLSWNNLSGTIPALFGMLKFLFYLDLSNNFLSGEIPKELTKLESLIYGNLSFEDTLKGFAFFFKRNPVGRGLQYNQISSFPPSLDLSNNMLVGPIWPEFGNLKMLHVLDLRKNNLSGHIPITLSEMTNLESLDLSYNNLSGTIPPSLVKLSFLSKFSVAHNQLSGRIPSGGQFLTFPNSSFMYNNGLCGLQSSPCLLESPEHPKRTPIESPKSGAKESIIGPPFGFGVVVGFVGVVTLGSCPDGYFPRQGQEAIEELIGKGGKLHLYVLSVNQEGITINLSWINDPNYCQKYIRLLECLVLL